MTKVLVLHGPNLNLLGTREPKIYGNHSLSDIDQQISYQAKSLNLEASSEQHNSESGLITAVHKAKSAGYKLIIINPGALTHTSVALRDAILAIGLPIIEIHLSNIYAREAFRQHSLISDIAIGCICGFGVQGYLLAIIAAKAHLDIKLQQHK